MTKKIRIEVDEELWDETPWIYVGPLLHGAFSYTAGEVRSPYLGVPVLHFYWDRGWTTAAEGKIKAEIVNDEEAEK